MRLPGQRSGRPISLLVEVPGVRVRVREDLDRDAELPAVVERRVVLRDPGGAGVEVLALAEGSRLGRAVDLGLRASRRGPSSCGRPAVRAPRGSRRRSRPSRARRRSSGPAMPAPRIRTRVPFTRPWSAKSDGRGGWNARRCSPAGATRRSASIEPRTAAAPPAAPTAWRNLRREITRPGGRHRTTTPPPASAVPTISGPPPPRRARR